MPLSKKRKRPPHYAGQPAPAQPQPAMAMVSNGGVNDAVNFAAEDFYKAVAVLKYCTKEYTVPHAELPPGVQSFASQQFYRMQAAGQMLDALGYQGVTEVLAIVFKPAVDYVQTTMAGWNKVITEEGEVQKIWDSIAVDERGNDQPSPTIN